MCLLLCNATNHCLFSFINKILKFSLSLSLSFFYNFLLFSSTFFHSLYLLILNMVSKHYLHKIPPISIQVVPLLRLVINESTTSQKSYPPLVASPLQVISLLCLDESLHIISIEYWNTHFNVHHSSYIRALIPVDRTDPNIRQRQMEQETIKKVSNLKEERVCTSIRGGGGLLEGPLSSPKPI